MDREELKKQIEVLKQQVEDQELIIDGLLDMLDTSDDEE